MTEMSDLCYLRKPLSLNFDGDASADVKCEQSLKHHVGFRKLAELVVKVYMKIVTDV